MNEKRITLWCALAAGALLFGFSAAAVGHVREKTDSGEVVKREGDEMTLRAYYYSFPPTGTRRDSLIRTKNNMELVPMDFEINHEWTTHAPDRKNGRDEIWYTYDSELLDGAPAACWVRSTCPLLGEWHIEETDIVIDQDESWIHNQAYLNHHPYGGDAHIVDMTIMHELGHALGLDHETRYYNVMGGSTRYMTLWTCPGTDKVEAYAGEDAGVGLVELYGPTSRYLRNDLSVTHWKLCGEHDGYSKHCFVHVRRVTTSSVSSDDFYGDMVRYNVTRGETYEFEFTYENNGYSTQYDVDIAYVVSTNDKISMHDKIILTTSCTDMVPNVPFTIGTELTIPSSLTAGQTYFLGIIIDCNDVIKEYKETNNTSFIPIEIY